MDDEFDDFEVDAAVTAAVEAAERAHAQTRTRTTAPAASSSSITTPISGGGTASGSSSKQPAKQPIPQKISRGSPSAIIVNTRQKGNPVLNYIKNVPWEYGDIIPDYVVGQTSCAFYLSLKYHRLHPEYIYNRIKTLGRNYNLRILLVMVDIDNHQDPLRELSKTALVNDLTLIVSWTSAEAGRYLETYKSYEHSNPTLIREKQSTDYTSRMVETLTAVRSVNKVDAVSLVSMFGSVRAAINASPEEIIMISGWGQQKVNRFTKAVKEPFRVNKWSKSMTLEERRAAAAASGGADEGAASKFGSSTQRFVRDEASQANTAAKLGIIGASQIPPASAMASKSIPASSTIWNVDDEDEDALLAAREAEVESEARRKTAEGRPPADGSHGGILDALSKLRENA